VQVTGSDGTFSASQTFHWNVNNPITIVDPGLQSFSAGDSVSLQIQASDAHPGTLSYFASRLPTGLSINLATGVITGTISNSILAVGSFLATVKVTDGTYSALRNVVFLILNPKPAIMPYLFQGRSQIFSRMVTAIWYPIYVVQIPRVSEMQKL
jgi:hypothetical protein